MIEIPIFDDMNSQELYLNWSTIFPLMTHVVGRVIVDDPRPMGITPWRPSSVSSTSNKAAQTVQFVNDKM